MQLGNKSLITLQLLIRKKSNQCKYLTILMYTLKEWIFRKFHLFNIANRSVSSFLSSTFKKCLTRIWKPHNTVPRNQQVSKVYKINLAISYLIRYLIICKYKDFNDYISVGTLLSNFLFRINILFSFCLHFCFQFLFILNDNTAFFSSF